MIQAVNVLVAVGSLAVEMVTKLNIPPVIWGVSQRVIGVEK